MVISTLTGFHLWRAVERSAALLPVADRPKADGFVNQPCVFIGKIKVTRAAQAADSEVAEQLITQRGMQ